MNWMTAACATPCEISREAALKHQGVLTKPAGSLGELEQLAVSFAAWQGRAYPLLDKLAIRVFAADHGVSAQGVSAFPPEVTVQMIENFVAGGAAISVLSARQGADFRCGEYGHTKPGSRVPGSH